MSTQPFRLVQPLARIFHRTLRGRIRETETSLRPRDVDCLLRYSNYDLVPHAELCEALLAKLGEIYAKGNIVFSSDDLVIPLKSERRGLAAIQHFPDGPPALDALKAQTESAMVQDVLRLSTDDLSSTDVSCLWSAMVQCGSWANVQALLHHFPLTQTLGLLETKEYRDLLSWVCFCSHTSPIAITTSGNGEASSCQPPAFDGDPTFWHAGRLLTDTLGLEDVQERLRHSLSASTDWHADAFAATLYFTTLRRCVDASAGFPATEAEWNEWAAASSGTHRSVDASLDARNTLSTTSASLALWAKRLEVLRGASVPLYVQRSFQSLLVSELHHHYRHNDHDQVIFFFLTVLPYMVKHTTVVNLRDYVRVSHDAVMRELFWTMDAAATAEGGAVGAPQPKKRGRWTSEALTGTSRDPTSAVTAAALTLSLPTTQILLLAEVTVQEEGTPLPASHIPALTAMLRRVVDHLRPLLKTGRGTASSSSLPPSLWDTWQPMQSVVLAVVANRLLTEGESSGGSGTAELHELAAETVEMLRRLLAVPVLEERGCAAAVTTLLTGAKNVVQAIGGWDYQAQLRQVAVSHVMDGFSRDGVMAMADAAEAVLEKESPAEAADTRSFVAQLRAAEQKLPRRKWK